MAVACSTKHNTWLSRGYQRMTSHYNVYYNGKEAFSSGLDKINKSVKEDYSRILPIYNFSITQNAKPAKGDMETALKKSHKLIELHSITVKPKRKENPTPRQRELQLKDEYNPYVAEAYLLMGQANVVLHDEKEAFKILDFLHHKFPSEHAAYESLIWKSIAHAQIGQLSSAKEALDLYDLDGLAPLDLYFDYQRARANICIEQEQYAEAIPFLESAIEEGSNKANIRRLKFILAQVYREVGQLDKAAPLFLELSKGIADYDMAFAAKMELASVAISSTDISTTEKRLKRMSNDVKNEDYLDQIYYAMGRLQQSQNNNDLANVLYRKSVNLSKSNSHQKGLSYLAMSDLAALNLDYLSEGTYVDSASQLLSVTNPRKAKSQDRASLLRPLTKELKVIHDNDSLLRIANMSEKERDKYLESIIKTERAKKEALEAAQSMNTDMGMSQGDFYRISGGSLGSSGKSSWYFYSTTLVQAGKSAFIQKWGQRPNEDNWRRSNKGNESQFDDFPDDQIASLTDQSDKPSFDKKDDANEKTASKEALLANIPLSSEAQEKTNKATALAMFNAGTILYEDIKDYPTATRMFNDLLSRYPKNDNRYDAIILLYFSATKSNNAKTASLAADMMKQEFPESDFASYLQKGANLYFADVDNVLKEHENEYRQTYDAYLMGNYALSHSYASQALAKDSEVDYHSKYLLIRALSSAKSGRKDAFEADLIDITTKYAHTPEDTLAQSFLALLKQGKSPVVHTEYQSPLEENRSKYSSDTTAISSKIIYEYLPDAPHSVVALVSADMQNRAQYLIANYNFSNFLIADYDISIKSLLCGSSAIQISNFANKQEAMQYLYSLREQSFFKEIVPDNPIPTIYAIPTEQIPTLSIDRKLEYDAIFQEYYLHSTNE